MFRAAHLHSSVKMQMCKVSPGLAAAYSLHIALHESGSSICQIYLPVCPIICSMTSTFQYIQVNAFHLCWRSAPYIEASLAGSQLERATAVHNLLPSVFKQSDRPDNQSCIGMESFKACMSCLIQQTPLVQCRVASSTPSTPCQNEAQGYSWNHQPGCMKSILQCHRCKLCIEPVACQIPKCTPSHWQRCPLEVDQRPHCPVTKAKHDNDSLVAALFPLVAPH